MNTVIQKINKEYATALDFAIVYYTLITNVNNIVLSNKEMNLLAFCAVHGTISTPKVRDTFIEQYKTPKGSVYNIVSKLQKLKLMVKINGKIRVNPALQLDFSVPNYKIELNIKNTSAAS